MTQLPLDAAAAVRPGEEINLTTLNKYLAEAEVPPIVAVQQFPGGYSNLTYFLQAQDQRGYVLRRPPFGAEHIRRGHDMGREYRVLTLLRAAGYTQVPRPVLFCDDVHVLGAPFYRMERVPGLILRAATAPTLGLTPAHLRGASEALVDNLVALHSLDLQQTGLLQLGKPEGYVKRQVEGWYQRYLVAQTDDLSAIERLYQWLVKAMPAENAPTLLHNDYKYDNLVLNPADLTDLRAVLDWEMCTVGDPLMDVGTALSYWAEAGDGPFEKSFNLTWLPGNLNRQAFADRYAERSGRDLSAILYYYVFGLFKNSVVMQQIYARWKKGLTQDKRFAGLLLGIESLSATAERTLERGTL